MLLLEERDTYFMQKALLEAKKALLLGEVPVGSVLVFENTIIAKGHNLTEKLCDVTAHSEMITLTAAQNYVHSKYLHQCTLYVTLEPCVMCAGACSWSQLGCLVYGAKDHKKGYSQINSKILHNKTKVKSMVMEKECENILRIFFKEIRNKTH
ncbi:MAG: nucleoside deaminase [Chitinophagaceae bacterium]|nr:nucleoside deaminase [Chitinophagaceae bacterium]